MSWERAQAPYEAFRVARLATPEPETPLFLGLEAARTGVLLVMDLLKPVIFLIQSHPTHGADPIATKVADTPRIS